VPLSKYPELYFNAQAQYSDAYTALVSLPRYVEAPNEAAATQADAFDPFSRIAFFGAAKDGNFTGFTKSEAEMMVRNMGTAPTMLPSGLAGLLFADKNLLALAMSTQDTGERLAVLSQAASLLSREYINSIPRREPKDGPVVRKNYDDAIELLAALGSRITLKGNLVTDMQASNVNIGSNGSIGLKAPYQDSFRSDIYNQIMPFNNFVNAMTQTRSLIPSAYTQQATVGSGVQTTGIVETFDFMRREQLRAFGQNPTGSFLEFSYADNYMDRRNSATNIIGQMNDIYNSRHKLNIDRWAKHPTSGSMSTQLSGSSAPSNVAGDVSANMAGAGPGQTAATEYYGKTTKTQGETDKENYLRANASNLGILGQNFYTANVNYWNNKKKKDAPGPDEVAKQVDEHTNAYLESTFPFSPNGTIIGTLVQDRTEGKETGGDYKKKSYYKGDVFVKQGGVWSHYISSRDLDELLDSKTGNGTLRDQLDHYFDQTMVTAGKMFVLDAAVEYNKATYDKTASPDGFFRSGRQLGVMLILQPGTKFAVGGVKTTTGDYAALFGYDNMKNKEKDGQNGFLFSGGFFALNPEAMPEITTSGLRYPNGQYYYDPTFRLYEKTPKESGKKTYLTSATWMLIDQYRATVYGGWRTDDNGLIIGEEYRRKNMNISSVFNFNNDWSVKSGIASVGGRLGRFDFTSIAVKPDDRSPAMAGGILSVKVGKEKSPTFGRITFTGSVNQNFFTNGKFGPQNVTNIVENAHIVVEKYSSMSANSLVSYPVRERIMRDFARDALGAINLGIENGLRNDLRQNQIMNFAMSYRGTIKGKPADFSIGMVQLGRGVNEFIPPGQKPNTTLFAMSNFANRFTLLGAYALEKGNDEDFKWIAGTTFRPVKRLKATLLVTETNASHVNSLLEMQLKGKKDGIAGITMEAGDRLFTSNLYVGTQKVAGIIKIGQMDRLKYGQAGMQFAKWDNDNHLASRFTIAGGLILAPGMKDGIAGISSLSSTSSIKSTHPQIAAISEESKIYTKGMQVYNLLLEYEKIFGAQNNWYFRASAAGFTTANGPVFSPKFDGAYDFYLGIGFGFRMFNYKTAGGATR
jgi:hypothetical protein